MSQVQTRAQHRNLWGWLPGVFFSLLAIFILSRLVSWNQVVSAVRSVDPIYIPIAIAAYLLGMLLRASAWYTLLLKKVKFVDVFFAMNEGYLLNNIFPLRLGEIGRAVILGKKSGLGMFSVLSTIVIERSIDLVFSAGLLLATIPLALGMDWARPLAWLIMFAVVGLLFGLCLGVRNRVKLQQFLGERFKGWTFASKWILPRLAALLDGFSVLTDLKVFASSLAFMAIAWIFAMSENWLVLSGLHQNPVFWWAGFIMGVAAIGGALPSVSGAVGVLEAAVVAGLVVLRVDSSIALAYGIILHIIHFVISSILGMIGLSRDGESLASIYREVRYRQGPTME